MSELLRRTGHTAVVQRYETGGALAENLPSLFEARDLAQRTLKKASEVAVISRIERNFQDYPGRSNGVVKCSALA